MDSWSAMKHHECGLEIHKFKYISSILQAEKGLFTRFQSLEFSPEFFTIASISSPWEMTIKAVRFGKTSYWIENVTRCRKTGVDITRNLRQLVTVDLNTRRPVDIPAENVVPYKKALAILPTSVFAYPSFPHALPDSSGLFHYSTRGIPSDGDFNDHINHSICFKYCADCASLAAMKAGILQKFSRDMAYYNLKKFSAEYVGEMTVGDDINVFCWENPSDPCILYFLLKIGENVVNSCVGEWYTSSDGTPVQFAKNVIPDIAKL